MFETILNRGSAVLIVALFGAWTLYFAVLVLYRILLSPIAKFPGPKLAAATYLYEGYYDVVKRGKYTFVGASVSLFIPFLIDFLQMGYHIRLGAVVAQ